MIIARILVIWGLLLSTLGRSLRVPDPEPEPQLGPASFRCFEQDAATAALRQRLNLREPSPVPCAWVVKKGSNTRRATSSVIPGPLSAPSILAPSSAPVRSVIVPAAVSASSALTSRLTGGGVRGRV